MDRRTFLKALASFGASIALPLDLATASNVEVDTAWTEAEKNAYADRCLEILCEYAPNMKNAVIHRQVISPLDMETEYNLTGGNILHGRLTLDQMFNMRPVPGYADYTTPVKNLFTCGSGAHPGGGVMGAPGMNSAKVILRAL